MQLSSSRLSSRSISFRPVLPLRNSARSVNLKMFALGEPNRVEVTCSGRNGKSEKDNVVSLSLSLFVFVALDEKEEFLSTLRAVKISLTVGGHHYLTISKVVCEPTRERVLH